VNTTPADSSPPNDHLVGVTFFFVLSERPLVFVISAGKTLRTGLGLALHYAKGRACHLLVRSSWFIPEIAPEIVRVDRWLRSDHPNAKLVSLVPTEFGLRYLTDAGIDAIWAHNTAFVDEGVFYPESGVAKLYDAVHNAQTGAFKRHELAHGVKNLALITYDEKGSARTLTDLVRGYRSLSFANYSEQEGFRGLDGDGIRFVLNRARCGLALSAVEGPHNASMEYFLCGLPLVTTRALGGREEMYDPRHVTIVEPRAEAVEAAVAAYVERAPDALEIRASALTKARPHRARLIAWLSNLAGEDLFARAGENLWLPQFRDKLRQSWRIEPRPGGGAVGFPIPGWAKPHP